MHKLAEACFAHYAHFQYFDYLIVRYFDAFAGIFIVIKWLHNNIKKEAFYVLRNTIIFTLFKKKWNIDEIPRIFGLIEKQMKEKSPSANPLEKIFTWLQKRKINQIIDGLKQIRIKYVYQHQYIYFLSWDIFSGFLAIFLSKNISWYLCLYCKLFNI